MTIKNPMMGRFYPSSGANFGFGDYPSSGEGEPKIIDFGQNSTSREEWRLIWKKEILPKLYNFTPDLIIISAGFDAHRKDDINLGYIGLIEEDYKWITEELMKIGNSCCKGRIVSVLEGGYAIQGNQVSAFARSVLSHVETLAKGVNPWETYQLANGTSSSISDEMNESNDLIGDSLTPSKRSRRQQVPVNYAELSRVMDEQIQSNKKQKADSSS